jgi:high-affinity iron transporter
MAGGREWTQVRLTCVPFSSALDRSANAPIRFRSASQLPRPDHDRDPGGNLGVEIGSFTSGLLTGLREGVEAALIVSIVLAYLVRTGNGRHASKIWLGAGAAVAVSVAAGAALFLTVGELQDPYEQLLEAGAMLIAASVVTWMLFWMRRQSMNVAGELRAAVDRVLTSGSVWGLALLAFVAVIREGIETSLFLVGQATAAGSSPGVGAASIVGGAVVGLFIAVAIGYGFFVGSRRINLGTFFRWTGVALVFIAAGLVSAAVHELIEIGVISFGTAVAFDISALLPHDEASGNVLGMLLRALFGYTSQPEIAVLGAWAAYLVVVLPTYLRPYRPPIMPSERTPAAGRAG